MKATRICGLPHYAALCVSICFGLELGYNLSLAGYNAVSGRGASLRLSNNASTPTQNIRNENALAVGKQSSEATIGVGPTSYRKAFLNWKQLIDLRRQMSPEDFRKRARQLIDEQRYRESQEYGILLARWGLTDPALLIKTMLAGGSSSGKTLQAEIDSLSDDQRTAAVLGFCDSNPTGDWLASADLMLGQQVDSANLVLQRMAAAWRKADSGLTPISWLAANASNPATQDAVSSAAISRYSDAPSTISQMLAEISDPDLKNLTALAISSQTEDATGLLPLRNSVDDSTWQEIQQSMR